MATVILVTFKVTMNVKLWKSSMNIQKLMNNSLIKMLWWRFQHHGLVAKLSLFCFYHCFFFEILFKTNLYNVFTYTAFKYENWLLILGCSGSIVNKYMQLTRFIWRLVKWTVLISLNDIACCCGRCCLPNLIKFSRIYSFSSLRQLNSILLALISIEQIFLARFRHCNEINSERIVKNLFYQSIQIKDGKFLKLELF